jgi:uroporphyrinogen III methyltransferase/synthase
VKAQIAGGRSISKVVITRSRKGNAELAESLSALGFESVSIDTIEFLPPDDWSRVDLSLESLGEFDWVVFTSPTGVESFKQRMRTLSYSVPWLGKPSVAAVGAKTSAALQELGVKVDFVPSAYTSRTLAEELPRDKGKALLVLRADIGDPEAVAILERDGFEVHDLPVYRTSAVSGIGEEPIERKVMDADAILFASPSSVEGFMKRLGPTAAGSLLAIRPLAICIGPVTEKAARESGFERTIASYTHTIDAMLQTLRRAATPAEGE